MKKNQSIWLTMLILFCLFTCLLSILTHLDFWSNLLLPLNAFLSAVILFLCYQKRGKLNVLFFSIASFAWGMGDCLWVVWDFFAQNPIASALISNIYFLANVSFAFALFVFSLKQYYNKWNHVQLYVDAFVIGLMSLMFLWMVFFKNDPSGIQTLLHQSVSNVVSLVLDVLLCIGILSFVFSVRSGKLTRGMKLISSGLVLFCVVDPIFYYVDVSQSYLPNSMVDFFYIFSLQLITLGAISQTYSNCESTITLGDLSNVGHTKRWIFLFLFPISALVLDLFPMIPIQVSALDIAILLFLVFFYWASCRYIQLSIENERLLEREKCNNERLEQRVAEQVAELTFLMNQDTLTTLFNRRYFLHCVDESIASLCPNETLALLLIDIDRFKMINDDFGHDVGDKILIDLSYRMMEWNNQGAVLARLGGDEFAVLLVGKYTRKEIELCCLELIALCNEPIEVGTDRLNMTISVGIALHSQEAVDSKSLMKHADISMYRAKAQGYNKYQFYDPLLSENIHQNRKIENMLKQVKLEQDFELFYQPQFSLRDKRIIGAEALIRWNHPEHGYIPPNLFIPVAEEIGAIHKIGRWVIQEVIRQSKYWNQTYDLNLKLGFNISSKQLDDEFLPSLQAMLSETGVNPAWLDAEITESVMIVDAERVKEIFETMKELNLSVSIDDFGAGYSSLSYLNKHRFDRIKIDKSLIDQVSSSNLSGMNVVRAVVSMAKAVGIMVLAEGVETQEQLTLLEEIGCEEAQGYLLGRPVPAEVFEQRFLGCEPHGSKERTLAYSTLDGG